MNEETVTYTVLTQQQWTNDPRKEKNPIGNSVKYTCHFKGNTMVDFEPRPDDRWYLNYRRDYMKTNSVQSIDSDIFVSDNYIKW